MTQCCERSVTGKVTSYDTMFILHNLLTLDELEEWLSSAWGTRNQWILSINVCACVAMFLALLLSFDSTPLLVEHQQVMILFVKVTQLGVTSSSSEMSGMSLLVGTQTLGIILLHIITCPLCRCHWIGGEGICFRVLMSWAVYNVHLSNTTTEDLPGIFPT